MTPADSNPEAPRKADDVVLLPARLIGRRRRQRAETGDGPDGEART
ncbi:MAG: hypothetical protein AB7R87_11875 [Parvibaculaceae bacterium]